ncbi:F-box/kelch-repeat protein At3g23880-like [Rhododendron vialii]|uniref:F-box/kelch-repeat protein At3g23880-like n=1 Tax=Rhododendron vialii TaxID=182163 RepID=UPI00265E3160|nr:F-box/kelch-repeat protein At3g23880-like [Rhododendron vialii]
MERKRNRVPDPRSRSAERKRRGRKEKNYTSEAESCFPNIILPEDIVVEILSRLSLGSLARFTCVSKQWCSLISNRCTTRSPTVLLISKSRAYSFSPHSLDRNHRKEVHAKSVYVPWNKIEKYINKFRILGSCNGLLLMHIDEDVFLWNPSTTFFKKMLAYEELRDQGYGVCSGLCYDSTSDEYKAVLALAHETPDYGGEFVVVGSFRSKSWTVIDFPYMLPSENMGPIVNGNLHWFASHKNDLVSRFFSPHQIIFFNAQLDKFEEVPMPKPIGEDGDILCGLGVLDGCLCMSRSDCPGDWKSNVEVLIMKEYGVKSSWTILFAVSDDRFAFTLHRPLVPLGYTKNGRVLIKVNYRGGYIRAFDLTDKSHRRISIPEHHYLHVIVHEESLITPTDYNWEEEDLKGVATYVQDSSHSRKMIMKKGGRGGYWRSLDYRMSLNYEIMSSECESDSE